ncbi:MAG: Gfo/Idh/MocA family protein [Chlorobium sp.]
MTVQPLSLGFVGGAPNSAAGYAHFAAARMDGLWALRAGVFSKHSEINREAAEIYGVETERVYESLHELLEQEAGRLDAVVLLTPTPLHHEMVMDCLRTGMPVICEKALALTSAEAREIQDLCVERNGFLAVIYNYSGYPMVRELRRMIREGVLGEILHFQVEMPQEGFMRTDDKGNKPSPQSWRLTDGPVPTIHLDLAVHLHELIHYLTGLKPIKVVSDQASGGWFDVVDNVTCLARYTKNVQGQFWFSKSALGHRNGLRLRLYGTKASAEWYQMNPEEVLISYSDGRRQVIDRASNMPVASAARYTRFKAGHPAGFIEALANLYTDIHSTLKQYKETGIQESQEVFGASLACDGLQFLEAMVESHCKEGWVSVLKD